MSPPGQTRTPLFAMLVMAGGFGLTVIAASVWWNENQTTPQPIETAKPDRLVSVVISGDTAGWIVPCGCASNQSGGLPRLGSLIRQIEQDRHVVLLDVGGSPGGESPYDREKFIAIVKGKQKMGLAAHNLGAAELKLGLDDLRSIQKQLDAPFLSANLRSATGELLFPASKIVEAEGKRLLVVGVISPEYASSGVHIASPADAVLSVVGEFRDRFDHLIVLAYLPEAELRQLASELPEADVVAGGPTGQSIAPERVGPVLMTAVTNKGKFAAHLQLTEKSGSAPWTGEILEVDASYEDDPEQMQNLKDFYALLEVRDFKASETGFVPTQPIDPPEGFQIAGSNSCLECHSGDHHIWSESGHSHAWATLVTDGSHVNSDCQRCHTTGFGLPGGFVSAGTGLERVNVGCESCHGPSQGHVADSTIKTAFVARDLCTRCHDRENSPEFEYASYWERIRHGGESTVTKGSQ